MSTYFGGPGPDNYVAPGAQSKSAFSGNGPNDLFVQHSAYFSSILKGPYEMGRSGMVHEITYDGSTATVTLKFRVKNPVPKTHPDHTKANVAMSLAHNALVESTGKGVKKNIDKAVDAMKNELERQLSRLKSGDMATVLKTESFNPARPTRGRSQSNTRRSASNPPPKTRRDSSNSKAPSKQPSVMIKKGAAIIGYKSGGQDYTPDLTLKPGMRPQPIVFKKADSAGKTMNANLTKLATDINGLLDSALTLMGADPSIKYRGKAAIFDESVDADGTKQRIQKGTKPFETDAHKKLQGPDFDALVELYDKMSSHTEANTGESETEAFFKRQVKALKKQMVSYYNYQLGDPTQGYPRLGRRQKPTQASEDAVDSPQKSAMKGSASPKPQRVRIREPHVVRPKTPEADKTPAMEHPLDGVVIQDTKCMVCGASNCNKDHTSE